MRGGLGGNEGFVTILRTEEGVLRRGTRDMFNIGVTNLGLSPNDRSGVRS